MSTGEVMHEVKAMELHLAREAVRSPMSDRSLREKTMKILQGKLHNVHVRALAVTEWYKLSDAGEEWTEYLEEGSVQGWYVIYIGSRALLVYDPQCGLMQCLL